MCKVHPLLQVDIRSNYYACHAGMRNWKITRNVCITLGQMFPSGRGTAQRDPVLLVRLFFPRIRAIVVDDLHPRCIHGAVEAFVFPRCTSEHAACLLAVNHSSWKWLGRVVYDESNSLLALMRERVKWSVRARCT